MKNIYFICIIFFITACSNIEFIYSDKSNLINPLYDKTQVIPKGVDLVFLNSYIPVLFGDNKDEDFNLVINIEEAKTKRSVEVNQAASNIRYELRFSYLLTSNIENCVTLSKEILSYFTIIPKSAGYNYGTDASLEKKYELAVTDNLNQFVSFLSNTDIKNCQ